MNPINIVTSANIPRSQSQVPAKSAAVQGEEVGTPARPGKSQAEPQARGVLRLLQEDHFKGVADVRLHINFQKQLAALDSAAAQSRTGEAVSTFDAAISEILLTQESIPESASGALQSFQEELSELGGAAEDVTGLSEDVDAAYAALSSTLNDLLTSDVAQAAGADYDAGELMDALASALDSFREALSSVNVSHEFTPPDGNGVAFAKFLEIYQSLSTAGVPAESEEVSGLVIDQAV